ncbi:MAG TPA: hypothetical protein VHV83_00655, partial [Armatimonadota bacterium]|nr:hypothetical protein [Armatimonadota bacterium]
LSVGSYQSYLIYAPFHRVGLWVRGSAPYSYKVKIFFNDTVGNDRGGVTIAPDTNYSGWREFWADIPSSFKQPPYCSLSYLSSHYWSMGYSIFTYMSVSTLQTPPAGSTLAFDDMMIESESPRNITLPGETTTISN